MQLITIFGEKINLESIEDFGRIKSLIEGKAYYTLMRIKAILEDDTLDDEGCFFRIEEIVREFEKSGMGCEYRHDF